MEVESKWSGPSHELTGEGEGGCWKPTASREQSSGQRERDSRNEGKKPSSQREVDSRWGGNSQVVKGKEASSVAGDAKCGRRRKMCVCLNNS